MKLLPIMSVLLVSTLCGNAAEILRDFDLKELVLEKQSEGGRLVTLDGKPALELSNTNSSALKLHIIKIPQPRVSENAYAVVGLVKYSSVAGDGYLELLNYFPALSPGSDESVYFSRTLANTGPMAKLSGSASWRRFVLPFDRTGTSNAPSRLELNLSLPGAGTVYLADLRLVQSPGGLSALLASATNAWWSDRTGGWFGGIAGATIGCFGGLLAWLAAKGRSRAFVLGSLWAQTFLGAASLLAACVALALHQPYGVWFVLLLFGALMLMICPFRLSQYKNQYQAMELRKMASLDAQGG